MYIYTLYICNIPLKKKQIIAKETTHTIVVALIIERIVKAAGVISFLTSFFHWEGIFNISTALDFLRFISTISIESLTLLVVTADIPLLFSFVLILWLVNKCKGFSIEIDVSLVVNFYIWYNIYVI